MPRPLRTPELQDDQVDAKLARIAVNVRFSGQASAGEVDWMFRVIRALRDERDRLQSAIDRNATKEKSQGQKRAP